MPKPKWITETPEMEGWTGYFLHMQENGEWTQTIEITLEEYDALKAALAKLRGYDEDSQECHCCDDVTEAATATTAN